MRDYTDYGLDTSRCVQHYCVKGKYIVVTMVDGKQYHLDKESEIFLQQLMTDNAKEIYEAKDEIQKNIDSKLESNKRLRFFGSLGTVLSTIGLGYTLIRSTPGMFESGDMVVPLMGLVGSLCVYGHAKCQQRKLYELEDDLIKIGVFFDHSDIFAMDVQSVDRMMLGLTKKQIKILKKGLPIDINSIDCLSSDDLKMLVSNIARVIEFEQGYSTEGYGYQKKQKIPV